MGFGLIIFLVVLAISILGFMVKSGVEINLDKKYHAELWKLVVLFMFGVIAGLWLPW